MNVRAHGQVRSSQVITTWGPGSLIDLPRHSGIVGGLETWPKVHDLEEIIDPRLTRKLTRLTGVPNPRLYAPPPDAAGPGDRIRGIGVWRFPEWMLVQEKDPGGRGRRERRLVHRKELDEKGRFGEDKLQVVPTRFVRACSRGHISDLNWRWFVHKGKDPDCRRRLWLVERGTGGDLADLQVRCECGARRGMHEAGTPGYLGKCWGARPWLGAGSQEPCGLESRLLIRTAANAYFAQTLSALSLPEHGSKVQAAVQEVWDDLSIVDDAGDLAFMKKKPKVATRLAGFSDDEVLEAISALKGEETEEPPVKLVELDALLAAPEGYGEDVPVDENFHARRLPDTAWRSGWESSTNRLASVVQLHRLREVLTLVGFTRFEAITPDILGDYEDEVQRAELALDPSWYPAVENRGEGLFVELRSDALLEWLGRDAVKERLTQLVNGFTRWTSERKTERPFPGGPYVLLHTLAHLLIQSVAMQCGYPASSIRERIYADWQGKRFGLMLYTASSDAEGTLGGLVSQARNIGSHLSMALRSGGLCSNDPVCAQHSPADPLEGRWLHGAACHGCALIAETSCEMRNDLLDRALVIPTLAVPDAAFFPAPEAA